MTEQKPAKIYRAKPTPGAKPPTASKEPAGEVREGQRIAKLLARAGVASRREIERMIGSGRAEWRPRRTSFAAAEESDRDHR